MKHATCRRVDAPLNLAGESKAGCGLAIGTNSDIGAAAGHDVPETLIAACLSGRDEGGISPVTTSAQEDYKGDEPVDDPLDRHEFEFLYGPARKRQRSPRWRRLRLFTATIIAREGGLIVQAFHASMATSSNEVLKRLEARYGIDLAVHADIRRGFRPASPLVLALVPMAVSDLLKQVEQDLGESHRSSFMIDNMLFIRA